MVAITALPTPELQESSLSLPQIEHSIMSQPLPPGVYVPAVLFMDKNEDLDLPATRAHILRLAKVTLALSKSTCAPLTSA